MGQGKNLGEKNVLALCVGSPLSASRARVKLISFPKRCGPKPAEASFIAPAADSSIRRDFYRGSI